MDQQMKAIGDLVQWFTENTDASITFRLHYTKAPSVFLAQIYYYNHELSQGVLCDGEWKKTAEATVKAMLKDAPRTEKAARGLAEYVRRGKRADDDYETNGRDPTGYEIPPGLSQAGQDAAEAIVAFLMAHDELGSGGAKVFYSPAEWAARGEEYGLESELIVTHDGGNHALFFNPDYQGYDAMEEMRKELQRVGVYVEQQTSWYSAIYPIPGALSRAGRKTKR